MPRVISGSLFPFVIFRNQNTLHTELVASTQQIADGFATTNACAKWGLLVATLFAVNLIKLNLMKLEVMVIGRVN